MMRIPELRPEDMTEEQKAVMQEIVSGPHGRVAGPYFAWLFSPELARRARSLSEFIRFQTSLPPRLSELAILVTGRFWRAEFEFYAHSILAKRAGLDDAVVSALAEYRLPKFKLEGERVVYDLITELLTTARVREATYARAVQALGQQTVVELVATAGYYSMVSLTLNAFQVPLPAGEPSPFHDPKRAPRKAWSMKARLAAAKKAAAATRKARPMGTRRAAKQKTAAATRGSRARKRR